MPGGSVFKIWGFACKPYIFCFIHVLDVVGEKGAKGAYLGFVSWIGLDELADKI